METSSFIISFIFAIGLHFAVQKLFIHYKRFDDFNHRSSHVVQATRTGGFGIFFTVLIISLYYYFHGIELFDYSLFIPLGIMFIIGVYDDLYNADFKLKFLLQIIVAKILIDQGYVISNYYGLFGLYEVPWLLAQATTVIVFLIVNNAINFIDGIDGLAITETIKTILIFEFYSKDLSVLSPLGFLVISSTLPLYYFNFKKQKKVFLGDAGSLLLGTLIMIYVLNTLNTNFVFKSGYSSNKTLFVVIVLIYPLIDLLRVFTLRIKDKKSPFLPDKRHIHHVLFKKTKSSLLSTLIILSSQLLLFHLIINLL